MRNTPVFKGLTEAVLIKLCNVMAKRTAEMVKTKQATVSGTFMDQNTSYTSIFVNGHLLKLVHSNINVSLPRHL